MKVASRKIDGAGDDWMLELKDGLFFRGADNTGKCLELDKAPSSAADAKTALEPKNYQHPYSEDPLLTFEDAMQYGCHLDMDYEEL